MKAPQVPLRYRLEHAGLAGLAAAVRRLPFGMVRKLARVAGSLVCTVDARGRRVGIANVEAAFPGRYDAAAKCRIVRDSYATFARTMFELLWAPNMNRAFVEKHVTFEGWDVDYCRKDPSRAAIYACFHYSNFEWLSLIGAYTIQTGPVIAQKFRNPLIGPVFDAFRRSTGNDVIPQERAVIRMLKLLKSGGKFGMLCDLNLDPREGSVPVRAFGGLWTSVTPTHAVLAQRTGAAIVPVECRPASGGGYRIIHHRPIECPPEAEVRDLVQACWDALEGAVREEPGSWLWPYKHWRFRPAADDERYPFYSNRAKRFDRLLRGVA